MTPVEKLIAIVDAAKGGELEVYVGQCAGMSELELDVQVYSMTFSMKCSRKQLLERLRAERAEWQAARDLLTRLLSETKTTPTS